MIMHRIINTLFNFQLLIILIINYYYKVYNVMIKKVIAKLEI